MYLDATAVRVNCWTRVLVRGPAPKKMHHDCVKNGAVLLAQQWQWTTTRNGSSVASPRPSFDFSKIRHEILQHWLIAQAKSGQTSSSQPQYCNFTYQDGVRAYQNSRAAWHWLDRELSSNLAGETGAVWIYKGALAAMQLQQEIVSRRMLKKDDDEDNQKQQQEALDFCQEHMQNEQAHLRLFETIVPANSGFSLLSGGKHTVLLPVWRVAGWTLGFVPTLVGGNKALYVTVQAVETFVEEHFEEQIVRLRQLEKDGISSADELVRLLEHCCADEVHHREDAAKKLLGLDRTIQDNGIVSNNNDDKAKQQQQQQQVFDAWWVQPWSSFVKTGSALAAAIARHI